MGWAVSITGLHVEDDRDIEFATKEGAEVEIEDDGERRATETIGLAVLEV